MKPSGKEWFHECKNLGFSQRFIESFCGSIITDRKSVDIRYVQSTLEIIFFTTIIRLYSSTNSTGALSCYPWFWISEPVVFPHLPYMRCMTGFYGMDIQSSSQ